MSWHPAHAVAKLQWTPGQPIAVTLPPTATMAAAAYSLLTQLPFEEEESELEIAEEPEDVEDMDLHGVQVLRLRIAVSTGGDQPVSVFIRALAAVTGLDSDAGDRQLARLALAIVSGVVITLGTLWLAEDTVKRQSPPAIAGNTKPSPSTCRLVDAIDGAPETRRELT